MGDNEPRVELPSRGHADALASLRPTRCPDCGYSFTGLPQEGRCTVWCYGYDPDQIIIFGWGRGITATPSNARGRRAAFLLLLQSMWVLLIPCFCMSGDLRGAGLLALFAISASLVVYWRRRLLADAPAPCVARLLAQGAGQRNGVGQVPLRPWDGLNFRLEPADEHRWRLNVGRTVLGKLRIPCVDIEFKCDAAMAEALRTRIAEWRGPAVLTDPDARQTAVQQPPDYQ